MTFGEPGPGLQGFRSPQMDMMINFVVALTVAISIKMVRSPLVSSLPIIPAASSMQLSRSFKGTMVGGAIFGMVSVINGLLMSFFFTLQPGAIVLISVVIFALCIIMKRFFSKGAPVTKVDSCND
jgi:zinc transport system permease protein